MKLNTPVSKSFIFILFSLLYTTACKKYTCQCTLYNTNIPETYGTSSYSVKKRERETNCTNKSTKPDSNGYYNTCIVK